MPCGGRARGRWFGCQLHYTCLVTVLDGVFTHTFRRCGRTVLQLVASESPRVWRG